MPLWAIQPFFYLQYSTIPTSSSAISSATKSRQQESVERAEAEQNPTENRETGKQ